MGHGWINQGEDDISVGAEYNAETYLTNRGSTGFSRRTLVCRKMSSVQTWRPLMFIIKGFVYRSYSSLIS